MTQGKPETQFCAQCEQHATEVLTLRAKWEGAEADLLRMWELAGKMVETLKLIVEWEFDIMGDCVGEARHAANRALALYEQAPPPQCRSFEEHLEKIREQKSIHNQALEEAALLFDQPGGQMMSFRGIAEEIRALKTTK